MRTAEQCGAVLVEMVVVTVLSAGGDRRTQEDKVCSEALFTILSAARG